MDLLEKSTIAGFNAMRRANPRRVSMGGRELVLLGEEADPTPNSRYSMTIEEADDIIFHALKTDVQKSGWNVVEGGVLSEGSQTFRIARIMPDNGSPIMRIRARVR